MCSQNYNMITPYTNIYLSTLYRSGFTLHKLQVATLITRTNSEVQSPRLLINITFYRTQTSLHITFWDISTCWTDTEAHFAFLLDRFPNFYSNRYYTCRYNFPFDLKLRTSSCHSHLLIDEAAKSSEKISLTDLVKLYKNTDKIR